MTPSTRRGSSLGAILGLALVTGTLVLAANLDAFEKDGAFEKDDTGVGGFKLPPDAPPVAGGEKVNLDQAVRLLAVPFYRPDTDLASDASLRDIWISEDKDLELYVRYMSGVTLKVRPAEGSWSNEEWAAGLAGDGLEGNIETIAGQDVFIVPQDLPSLGSARLFVDGALVTLIGEGDFSIDELRTLAGSALTGAAKARQEKLGLSESSTQ